MHKFSEGYSVNQLVFLLVKYILWTGFHLGILYWLRYMDHERIMSETAITIFMVPVGLVNFALMVDAVRSLKIFHWPKLVYLVSVVINFVLYAMISMQMYSQAGSMTN